MTSEMPPSEPTLSLDGARQIDRLCDAFEKAWIAGSRPIIEDYLLGTSGDLRRELLRELIQIDVFYRRRIGDNPAPMTITADSPRSTPAGSRRSLPPGARGAAATVFWSN